MMIMDINLDYLGYGFGLKAQDSNKGTNKNDREEKNVEWW